MFLLMSGLILESCCLCSIISSFSQDIFVVSVLFTIFGLVGMARLTGLKDCIAVSGGEMIINTVRSPLLQTLFRFILLHLHGVVLDPVHDYIRVGTIISLISRSACIQDYRILFAVLLSCY